VRAYVPTPGSARVAVHVALPSGGICRSTKTSGGSDCAPAAKLQAAVSVNKKTVTQRFKA
jgi:hypothetical protein